ncbi:hypothetical protein M2271_001366 [Streptomyces sp. LBL]|uniref:hypothetical protein n=1 Tax=Streptomyces sp. LBL TaxID=2940562 RepID=UPI002475E500|nr:hypothetical protein [Streptomyces sp. LBL]MDH6623579.1 hypothetical protein [Streptomyces sp. LBL]
MVFDNIFGSAKNSAGLFSVKTDKDRSQPGVDDFEEVEQDAYDDKSTSLFSNAIHGASSRAKVVQEQSPEARAVLGFLGSFIRTAQKSADAQEAYAKEPSSVSTAAFDGMNKASERVTVRDDLKKNEDLEDKPKKDNYTKHPKAPETPQAKEAPAPPTATAQVPKTLGETKKTNATAEDPPSPQ